MRFCESVNEGNVHTFFFILYSFFLLYFQYKVHIMGIRHAIIYWRELLHSVSQIWTNPNISSMKDNRFKYINFATQKQVHMLAQSVRELVKHVSASFALNNVCLQFLIINNSFIFGQKHLKFETWQDYSILCMIFS